MEYHAPLTVIPEGLAVALLVGDLADLSLTVVAVGDHAAVGIPGTGDIARKVIGIAFLPAVCLADVLDASPCVQVIAGLIAVAVYNTRDPLSIFLGITHLFSYRVCKSGIAYPFLVRHKVFHTGTPLTFMEMDTSCRTQETK